MQKIWSNRNKRSPSTPETKVEAADQADESASQISSQNLQEQIETGSAANSGDSQWFLQYLPKIIADNLTPPREWQVPTSWLILAIGLGGLAIVTTVGMRYLTIPDSPTNSFSCKSKIQGDWQTPFGKITLTENASAVSGKYEYVNFERGKVSGELTGELNNNIVSFRWQETADQQVKSQGQGTLIFSEGCQEFYGSYGGEGITNSFASWQGYRINK